MNKGINDDKENTKKINGRREMMTHLSLGFPTGGATLGDHPKPHWRGSQSHPQIQKRTGTSNI